jgi:VWFA-related protein
MRYFLTIFFLGIRLLLPATNAAAQQVGGNAPFTPTSHTMTINVTSQLVVETVVVKDKQGNSISNLTAKNFTLTEHQQLTETASTALPVSKPSDEDLKIYYRLARSDIAPEAAGNIKYNNRRLLAMFFDMTAMPIPDQLRALTAAQKFIRTQMTPADLVAVMRFQGGSVDVLQDFTDDRSHILSILQTMIVGEGQASAEVTQDSSTSDTGAAFGQDDSEFNIFNTDRQLSALQTAANMLGRLSEKKSLIYFASGLRLNGVDNQAQLHATVDAAVRAGVSFWPIDTRGLVASAPLGDATQGSQGNSGMYTGAAGLALNTNFQQSQDTLFALAGDTGGKALLDYNDLTKGIVQAQHSISDYYIIGYYTSNTTQDGKFRRIKITVDAPEAKLDFRQGYYAGKTFNKFTVADKERQLEDALMLADPITELTIAMEINYFQLNRAEYFVPIFVKIPGRELALAKKGGAEHTLIDFIGEVKDNYGGTTVSNIKDVANIKLSDQTAEQLASRPIEYYEGFTLLPGSYTIKFLARDDETGRIGTFQTTFTIPNLNKEDKRVPTSTVVLSGQKVEPKDAIYNAMKAKDQAKATAADPLFQTGETLIPSVTRVFNKGRDIFVFLQAYETGVTPPQPLIAFVSFYNDKTKVFETLPMEVSPDTNTRLGTVPLRFNIPLNQLPSGKYDCQVTILNPNGQKATFWQAPILLVQ